MAGIGFDLRRLVLEEQGLFGRARAYATAGVIAAGPWLVTVASLWFVRFLGARFAISGIEPFLAIVSLVFAGSLITMGGLQMAATRWLADVLFRAEYGALAPAFARLFVIVAAVQAVVGSAACLLGGIALDLVVPITLLYVAVCLSWLAFVWLSLIRQHDKILLTFLLGAAVFAGALLWLGDRADLPALLWAYALANGLIVAVMAVLVLRGTEAGEERGLRLGALLRNRTLWLTGTVYALSLWADKFVFWWLDGVWQPGLVPHHPLYDTCFYVAYVSVVPALAVNLVHLETGFYEQYRGFYAAVEGHATLRDIRRREQKLRSALVSGTASVLRVQGAVTFACLWFAPGIAAWVGLPTFAAHPLRLAFVGSFCHVLMLLAVLVLLYFDRQRAALRTALVFLTGNVTLAVASVQAGPTTYGLGYALAGLLAVLWGAVELRSTLRRLVYVTFAQQ